jgi:hypothetical protein
MSKTKALLRFGLWPDGRAPTSQPAELTNAARRTAATAIEELNKLGVTAELDKAGKAHFRSTRILPPAARLLIERQGDLIESFLIERAIAELKQRQEQERAQLKEMFATLARAKAKPRDPTGGSNA